jgi:hypothetical protein
MAVDVYQAFLGVPPGKRPPNYYELLGLPPFAAEPPVIAEAVEAAKAKLKPFMASSQAMEASRVLGEIEQARKVLLNAASRKEYEQSLRGAPAAVAAPVAAAAPVAPPAMAAQAIQSPPMAAMPVSAVPVQALPVQAMPVQAMPAQAVPMQAMPVQAMPMQAMPVQAMPVQGGIPMAQVAQPLNSAPFGAAVNPNSTSAIKVNYQRKKKNQNALVYQLIGAAVGAMICVGIYANWEKIQPKPVYTVAKNPQVAHVEPNPYAKPDLSKLNPNYGKSTPAPTSSNPTKPVSSETLAEINKKLDAIANTPAMPPKVSMDNPTGEAMPKSTTPAPTKMVEPPKTTPPTTTTPEPAKPKEGTKADAKEAAAIKKALDEARAALRTLKGEKAVEALDLAMLEATADDSNAAIERMKKVVEANQKFWDSALEGAKGLKALDELKEGDEVVGNVVEVDDNKALVKYEGRNQPLLFKSPDKWIPKLAMLCAEKALGKGSEAANLYIGAYLMTDAKGDRDKAKAMLEAAGAAGAPLLEELNSQAK